MEKRLSKTITWICVLLTGLSVSLFIYKTGVLNENSRITSRLNAETASDTKMHGTTLQRPVTLLPLHVLQSNFSKEGVCAKTIVGEVPRDATWQPVDKGNTIYLISAYFINTQGKVYIIGAKPMYDVAVICQLWSRVGENKYRMLRETNVKVGTPNDPAGPLPYTAAIFECLLDSTPVPTHVSLVKQSCGNPQNLVYVHNASKPSVYKNRFTVCVAPIFSYGAAHELVEWFELNRILGADRFIFYNYSTAINVDQVVYHYVKLGLVEVIPWRLPFPVTNHIHYFGQTAALNDCLFRNKKDSEFITNIDVDEFIVPHFKDVYNWSQLLTQLNNYSDGYIFRNTFFRKEWTVANSDIKQKAIVDKFQMVTLKHVEREQKIYPPHDRGKYFARTARAHYTLIHEIPRVKVQNVAPDIGFMHHYRNWQNYKDGQPRVKDLTIPEKFGDLLIKNVQKIWNELEQLDVSLDVSEV